MEESTAITTTTANRDISVFDRVDPMTFINEMGKVFAISGVCGCKTEQDGKVMALACLHQKRHLFEIAEEYHFMDGKLAIKSDEALTRFQEKGGKSRWIKDGTDRIEAILELSGWDGVTITSKFTIQMATDAGLVKEKSNWVKWAPAMLRSRCITEGIRMQWPGILKGHSSIDEIADYLDESSSSVASKPKAEGAKRSSKASASNAVESASSQTDSTAAAGASTTDSGTIVEAEYTVKKDEKAPFDVGTTTSSTPDVKAESAAKSQFQANLMELELLISQAGWQPQMVLDKVNAKSPTKYAKLEDLPDDVIERVTNNVRNVVTAEANKKAK